MRSFVFWVLYHHTVVVVVTEGCYATFTLQGFFFCSCYSYATFIKLQCEQYMALKWHRGKCNILQCLQVEIRVFLMFVYLFGSTRQKQRYEAPYINIKWFDIAALPFHQGRIGKFVEADFFKDKRFTSTRRTKETMVGAALFYVKKQTNFICSYGGISQNPCSTKKYPSRGRRHDQIVHCFFFTKSWCSSSSK